MKTAQFWLAGWDRLADKAAGDGNMRLLAKSVWRVTWARERLLGPIPKPKETVSEHLSRIIPSGDKCHGCPKGDPHGIAGYTGDVFCHLLEEVIIEGNKECGINE